MFPFSLCSNKDTENDVILINKENDYLEDIKNLKIDLTKTNYCLSNAEKESEIAKKEFAKMRRYMIDIDRELNLLDCNFSNISKQIINIKDKSTDLEKELEIVKRENCVLQNELFNLTKQSVTKNEFIVCNEDSSSIKEDLALFKNEFHDYVHVSYVNNEKIMNRIWTEIQILGEKMNYSSNPSIENSYLPSIDDDEKENNKIQHVIDNSIENSVNYALNSNNIETSSNNKIETNEKDITDDNLDDDTIY